VEAAVQTKPAVHVKPRCIVEGCTTVVQASGVCKSHGAYGMCLIDWRLHHHGYEQVTALLQARCPRVVRVVHGARVCRQRNEVWAL